MYKSGFVAVLGKPSAGKSSLVNKLVGFEVAIVNAKPQTTRFNIKGIRTSDTSQIIFIDTPGVHNPKNKLGEYMMKGVNIAREGVDVVLYLVDARKPVLDDANKKIMRDIISSKQKVILAINKVDSVKKENILRIIEEYNKYILEEGGKFESIVPISVFKDDGLDALVEEIEKLLPEGELIFEEDDITDIPEKDIVAEIIRGKALSFLNEEIPHGINVTVEKMKHHTTENGNVVYNIETEIICKKDSHKPIIIGKEGSMLKRITDTARKDIQNLLDARVNLKIWVKVRSNWEDNDIFLKNIKDKIK